MNTDSQAPTENATETETITAEIPFSGFCESIWSSGIDNGINHAIEYVMEFEQPDTGDQPPITADELRSEIHQHIDYGKLYTDIARDYADRFIEWMHQQLGTTNPATSTSTTNATQEGFVDLVSPREYNFQTDRLYVCLTEQTIHALYQQTETDTMGDHVCDRWRSRSGFLSTIPSDYDNPYWLRSPEQWDSLQLLTLIEAWAIYNGHDLHKTEYELFQDVDISRHVDNHMDMDAAIEAIKFMRELG